MMYNKPFIIGIVFAIIIILDLVIGFGYALIWELIAVFFLIYSIKNIKYSIALGIVAFIGAVFFDVWMYEYILGRPDVIKTVADSFYLNIIIIPVFIIAIVSRYIKERKQNKNDR